MGERLKDADREQLPAETVRRADPPVEEREDDHENQDERLLGLQRTVGNEAVTQLLQHDGEALSPDIRSSMESSFNKGFGDVKIHQSTEVDKAAEGIEAAAFTVGSDIFVHSSVPGPETPAGRVVLSEELAHVAQGVGSGIPERVTSPTESIETEAHQAAIQAARGEPATVGATSEAPAAVGRIVGVLAGLGGIAYWLLSDEEKAEEAKKGIEHEWSEMAPLPPDQKRRVLGFAGVLEAADGSLRGKDPDTLNPDPLIEMLGPLIDQINAVRGSTQNEQVGNDLRDAANAVIMARTGIATAVDPQLGRATAMSFLNTLGVKLSGFMPGQEPPAEGDSSARDYLTPGEADQLKGDVAGMKWAGDQLALEPPDYSMIISRLAGVRESLANASAPPPVKRQLQQISRNVDGIIQVVTALSLGKKESLELARSHLATAIGILKSLGGAEEPEQAPAAG
jgi:hypothetical protein